jgi:hypothetical protein
MLYIVFRFVTPASLVDRNLENHYIFTSMKTQTHIYRACSIKRVGPGGSPIILTDVFRAFAQILQTNAGVVSQIRRHAGLWY